MNAPFQHHQHLWQEKSKREILRVKWQNLRKCDKGLTLNENAKTRENLSLKNLAEREGFEPSIRFCRIHDFQSGAFDHSAISPYSSFFAQGHGKR